jgi:hypothetical protein
LSKGVSTEFWFNKGTDGDSADAAATATITIAVATVDVVGSGDVISLVATDGRTITCTLQGVGGTTTSAATDGNVTAETYASSTDNTLQATSQAVSIATAINNNNFFTATNDANVVTVTQAVAGATGNTAIKIVELGAAGMAKTDFTGGVGISATKQVLFDLWNGEASSSAGYGRLLVGYSGSTDGEDPFYAHLASGSNAWDMTFGGSTVTTASLKDTWNHIGFTFFSSSADAEMQSKFYYNGRLQETTGTSHMATFGEVTGSLIAYIGALQTNPYGNAFDGLDMATYGKLSGSLDEFRYWKTKRTEKDIQYNWWTQVRGGSNNRVSNADLGVYYKFNEGITTTSSIDSVVLDYSGRISNGNWVGYPGTSARNVGSAIVSASVVVTGTVEYKDPIIYSFHPDVLTLYNDLSSTGSYYDHENNASIMDSLPGWIIDEDEAGGSQDLKKLTQVLASYFDTLHLQISSLAHLKDKTYTSASFSPYPFADRLVSSTGLITPNIFVDSSILERFANRRGDRAYGVDINEIKSLIYENIYNNIIDIYKSKGTEKAFRNLIHCFGIGDEIIKFNAYGNNTTFTFADTDYETVTRKNFIDFHDPTRFGGTVYQNSSSTNSETTHVSYVSGTAKFLANTAEVEVIFPRRFDFSNPGYFHTSFQSASIFGCHVAADDPTDFTFSTAANDYNFQLYAVKTALNSKDVYFQLKDRKGNFDLTSSVYSNVYDNQKWNFAIRVKNKFWPYANGITGSGGNDNIIVDWYGVNTELGVVKNEFSFTASSLNIKHLTENRRYYAGADRTAFTGTAITETDVRISSVRHWATYLDDIVIREHAKDPENIGTLYPSRNAIFMVDSTATLVDNVELPEAATLSLNWDFSQITGSDANGRFTVEDASSGSAALRTRYPDVGKLSTIIGNQYAGEGYFPHADAASSSEVVTKDYIPTAKQSMPEVINSSDAVKALSRDDELYPRDASVSQVFFAFEKSMYGVISQEMVNMFATIVEFNNLIGEVTNKYRGEYKDLRRLRNLFFEKIQNNPDLDKFIDYYKWIDSSIMVFLQQLVPASANVSDEIRIMIEDHILGRNKYRHQYPMLDYKGNERWGADEDKLEARIKGISELTYNWEFGHATHPYLVGSTAATATITIAVATVDVIGQGDVISLVATDGTTITCTLQGVGGTTTSTATDGNVTAETYAGSTDNTLQATAQAVSIATAINNNNFFTATNDANVVTVTQAVAGTTGNTVITITELGSAGMSKTDFVNGTDKPPQSKNALWWKNRAKRSKDTFGTAATIDTARQSLNDIILSFNSASVDDLNDGTGAGGTYAGSTYAIRQLTKTIKLTPAISREVRGGYNFPRGQKPDFVVNVIKPGDTTSLTISTGSFKDVLAKETGPPILQEKRKFVEAKTDNSAVSNDYNGDGKASIYAPIVQYSSSNSSSNNAGYTSNSDNVEFAGYHTDGYGFNYEVPMQGPFTEAHVGGFQHRHIDLNTTASSRGPLDAPNLMDSRPEAWEVHNGNTFTTRSSVNYPPAYANYRRDEFAKRPVNIRNIQHTTASQKLGNFFKNYEVVQTSDRKANNLAFIASGGFSTASITATDLGYVDGLIDYEKPVRKKIDSVIVERFSAPGGPEVAGDNQGGAGLDYESGQYSPYNNLNYRNLSVRNPLRTLLKEHSAQFGLRSGSSVSATDYTNVTASFHKVNRNGLRRLVYTNDDTGPSGTVGTGSVFDNFYVQHQTPRSDLQYAWITASYTSSNVNLYGYFSQHVYNGNVRAPLEQQATKATTTWTVNDGDGVVSDDLTEKDSITIVSTDGTSRRYVIVDDGDGLSADVANGDVLEAGDNTGSGTLSAGDAAIGGIAVLIDLEAGDTTSQNGFLRIFRQAILHPNGHNGKITITAVPDDANGNQSITLTQLIPGTAGNRTVTNGLNAGTTDTFTIGSGFSGGIDYAFVPAVNFVTSSFTASALYPPVDFVGLNTTIVEEIHPRSFLVSASDRDPTVQRLAFGGAAGDRVFQDRAFASGNALFSHRGYVYGYPTWKQIRVGQSPLGRYYRNNNLYTHTPFGGEEISVNVSGGTSRIKHRYSDTLLVSQSAITTKYHPIVHELIVRAGTDRKGNDKVSTVVIQTSFANGLVTFENNEFSDKLGTKISLRNSAYKQLLKSYKGSALEDPSSPIIGVKSIRYKETVYPSADNMYTKNVRGRTSYENNFWRDSRANRTILGASKKAVNSMDKGTVQSAWALDADVNFATHALLGSQGTPRPNYPTGGQAANDESGFKPGELQNKYVHFIQRDPYTDERDPQLVSTVFRKNRHAPGVLYARKHIMPFTGSVAPHWGMKHSNLTIGVLGNPPRRKFFLKTSSVGSGEAFWDAPTLAGRFKGTGNIFVSATVNPFYDTYSAYLADIRARGKDYSIIPEFRISEHLDFYSSSSNFLAENLRFLTIAGVPSGTLPPQNSDEDNFFKIFSNSDFMKYFEIIKKDHEKTNKPKFITLRCKAIKKFIPYDGFYPAERTVQMATQFSKSLGAHVTASGIDYTVPGAKMRTFLKPFFSPGILYNTIKSGLAVDYPIMTGSFRTVPTYNSASGPWQDTATPPHPVRGSNERYITTASFAIGSNSRSGSFYNVGGIGGTTDEGANPSSFGTFYRGGHNHFDGWDYRIPFEALVSPEDYVINKNIVDDEPTVFANVNITASWSGEFRDNKYKFMMHNFLAESMNLFLKRGKPTEITSLRQEDFLDVTPGQPYGMRIKLYRSMTEPNPSSGSWGDFPLPQNLPSGSTHMGWSSSSFEMYSRPSAFGPPVASRESHDSGSGEGTGDSPQQRLPYSITGANEWSPANGIYASHTPPYYDGESWVDIIYYPFLTYDTSSQEYNNTTPFRPSLKRLQTLAPIPSYKEVLGQPQGHRSRIGQEGAYVVRWRFDQQALFGIADSTYWCTGTEGVSNEWGQNAPVGPMAGPSANIWAMQGDASLNIFERTDDNRWKIQTKFETPMLNFKYLAEADMTLPTNAGKPTVPRGMWHQFGRFPQDEEGVFMQVKDIPDRWLDNHPSGTVAFDLAGRFLKAHRNSPAPQSILQDDATALSGYRLPRDLTGSVTKAPEDEGLEMTTPKPLSLVDVCGFNTDPVRIGEVRNRFTISEAIVAVPFYEAQGERRFFKIINPREVSFDRVAGSSVQKQVRLMRKYVFPPFLDFVTNPGEVDPMAMYIFEFSHKLTKDDLSHIWQNLPPKIGQKAAASSATITHQLLMNELMGDPNEAMLAAEGSSPRSPSPFSASEVKKKLQWMVFKVKQRARGDYYAQIGGKKGQPSFIPSYTYNWPYDFCSLVELAQIDATVQFGGSMAKNPRNVKSELKPAEVEALLGREGGGIPDLLAAVGGVEVLTRETRPPMIEEVARGAKGIESGRFMGEPTGRPKPPSGAGGEADAREGERGGGAGGAAGDEGGDGGPLGGGGGGGGGLGGGNGLG